MSRSWASWILTDNADFITGSGHLTTLLTTLCAFIGDGRHILPEGQHIVRLLFGNRGDRCQMDQCAVRICNQDTVLHWYYQWLLLFLRPRKNTFYHHIDNRNKRRGSAATLPAVACVPLPLSRKRQVSTRIYINVLIFDNFVRIYTKQSAKQRRGVFANDFKEGPIIL